MSREKVERNNLIYQDIESGNYLVDIAKKFNVSASLVSKLKRRYFKKLVEENKK